MKTQYILIYSPSLYRVESRYKKPYAYRGVALKHAERIGKRDKDDYMAHYFLGSKNSMKMPEEIHVVSEEQYGGLLAGKGEWKTNLISGVKFWCEFDTPSCCDPSTETYHSM